MIDNKTIRSILNNANNKYHYPQGDTGFWSMDEAIAYQVKAWLEDKDLSDEQYEKLSDELYEKATHQYDLEAV